MNPVDHPMGGGKVRFWGRTCSSPWGHCLKDLTRKKSKPSNAQILVSAMAEELVI